MSEIQYPPVERRPVYTFLNNNPAKRNKAEGFMALVNPETGNTYAVHTDKYQLVKHEDILEPIMEALNREKIAFTPHVEFPDDGAMLWAKLILKDIAYEIRKGDFVNPSLEIFGSYNRQWATKMLFGAFRLVCTNGLVVGVTFDIYYRRHLSVFDPADAIDMVRNADNIFTAQTETWKSWSNTLALPEDYEKLVQPLGLSKHDLEAIGNEVEASSGQTIDALRLRTLDKWSLYNIVTQYLSHSIKGSLNRQAYMFMKLRNSL